MLRVGLTGSIATGKSFVSGVLGELGCRVIDADRVAREVVESAGRHLGVAMASLVNIFDPDLIVIGGGISKKSEKFFPHLTARTRIVRAEMLNEAGIAGAALAGIPQKAPVEAAE